MQTATHLDWKQAGSGARPSRLRRFAWTRLPLGCAAGAAILAFFVIAPATYQTHATVEVVDPHAPSQQVVIQSAITQAVSKPVIARAAASLLGTSLNVPGPGFADRFAVAFGYRDADSKRARLEGMLADRLEATAGEAAGSIEVSAKADEAGDASRIATVAAEALLAEQDDAANELRRKRAEAAAGRMKVLRALAQSAHQRLAALDPVELDPAQARASAAAQTAAAQARLDTIKAIMASGSPPLSDRRDVPQTIETLQRVYLDVSRELAKARETLGDKHFTIISLREGVQRAGQNLTAEWHRLRQLAEADVRTSKDREASLRKAETPAEIERRATFAAAHDAAQAADEAVAKAEAAQREVSPEERPYRLVARAPVPSEQTGASLPVRLLLAALAGALAWGAARAWPKLRRPHLALRRVGGGQRAQVSSFFEDAGDEPYEPVERIGKTSMAPQPRASEPRASEPRVREPKGREPERRSRSRAIDPELAASFRDVVEDLDGIKPRFGVLPSIMFAAHEEAQDTTAAALAFGSAATERGWRVLVIETDRSRPELAAAADQDGAPILVDLFGTLRVALRAEAGRGRLHLAPCFADGKRIASALARDGDTHYVDDLASDFDLVVIDGGVAAESAAQGWQADAYIRVGRAGLARHEERFLSTLEASRIDLLGTVTASSFVPADEEMPIEREERVVERQAPPASYSRRSAQPGVARPRTIRPQASTQRRRPG